MRIRGTTVTIVLLAAAALLLVVGSATGQATYSGMALTKYGASALRIAPPLTITLTPVADASIRTLTPGANYGSADTLVVHYWGENMIARALIRFNLAAEVPSNAIIDSARLDLYLQYSDGADPINLVAARLTEDWVESEVTWNNRPATGEPVVATLVDATLGYKSLDVTEIVQAWHNFTQYGLELSGPEVGTGYDRTFESREYGENPPQLVVTYHVPPVTDTPIPTVTATPPTTVECVSCSDCSAKLNGSYETVLLKNSITDKSGSCILFNSSNTIFDCQGFTIDGDDAGESSYGIQMVGKTGNTIRNCTISDFQAGISLTSSDNNNLISNTLFSNWVYGIYLNKSHNNNLSGNNITQNWDGVGLWSSNSNSFADNVICKQEKQDIYAWTPTSGNTRSGNKCNWIYNWNGDDGASKCDQVCTPNVPTTCSSEAECQNSLNGDYNYVTLTGNLVVPGGLVINGSHLTLDCNGHTISGSGASAGIVLDKIGVTIKNCTIKGFNTGIGMWSSSLNSIHDNTITSNSIGISLAKTDQGLKPQRNSIYDNSLRENSQYGLELSDAEENNISSNDMSKNSLYSIWVSGSCDNNITDNKGGDGEGILYWHDKPTGGSVSGGNFGEVVLCNVHNATVENLHIDNGSARNDGILLVDSSTTHIRNNWITRTNGILAINSDHISIHNNNVISSENNGIRLDLSEGSRIYSNTVENNNGSGILVRVQSDHAEIFSNTIESNSRGIEVSYSDDIDIRDNTIRLNTNEGIEIKGCTGTDLFRNDILGNSYGLFFDVNTTQSSVNENRICYSQGKDIYNNGSSNTGDKNTCSFHYRWKDSSVSDGCSNECVGWYNMKWGYSFHNPAKDELSYDRYAQTFGDDEVYVTIKACIGVPLCLPFVGCYCLGYEANIPTPIRDPAAYIYYYHLYKNRAKAGSCYGMSTTSLRFFYGDDYPSYYDSSATRVRDLTPNSAQGSYDLEVRREIHHGSQMSQENISYYLNNLGEGNEAVYVLNRAREGLKNRNQNMVSIKQGLTRGHVMNYDSVVDFDNGTSKIYVYDNNKEKFVNNLYFDADQYPAIIIDRNTNSWSYKKNGEVWENDMIYDIPYSVANRDDWTLPTSINGLVKTVLGDGKGNVVDMEGNLLGYDEFNNTYEDIPVGLGVPVFAEDEVEQTMLAVQPGDYNFNIFGSNGEYSDLIVGLNSAYVLENISSNDNTREYLEFRMINGNPYYNELSFQTSDVQKPFNAKMFRSFGGDFDRRMYRIFNTSITHESKIYMKVSSDYNSLVFSNRGSDTLTYDVEFQNEMVDTDHYVPDEIPRLLVTNLQIDPDQTQTITPENWGNLKDSEVTINTEICGDMIRGIGEDHVNCPQDCEASPCVVPHDDLHITESTVLSHGTYDIADEGQPGVIVIDGDGVVLDCNGAKLVGNGEGIGISSDSKNNITIKNCYIQNYDAGIVFENVTDGTVSQSALVSNSGYGIEFTGTRESQITQNYIRDNVNGIHVSGSTDTEISQNLVCPNGNLDILADGSVNNIGFDNACDNTLDWDDLNSTGCTFKCTSPTSPPCVYLPLVLKNYQ